MIVPATRFDAGSGVSKGCRAKGRHARSRISGCSFSRSERARKRKLPCGAPSHWTSGTTIRESTPTGKGWRSRSMDRASARRPSTSSGTRQRDWIRAYAARASVKLAELDPERAEEYYRKAAAAEEKGSGSGSPRVAVVLYAHARELRARNRDREAEPLLRRALAILQAAPESDPRVTIDVLNALGNLRGRTPATGRSRETDPRRHGAGRREVRAGERATGNLVHLPGRRSCGIRKAFARPACCSAAQLPSMPRCMARTGRKPRPTLRIWGW